MAKGSIFLKPTRADVRFVASLIVVHLVYFLVATQYKCIYNGDSLEYINMAINFNKGWFYSGSLLDPFDPMYYTLRPPGYPFFLWLIYIFGVNNWIVLLLQNAISVFNILYLRSTLKLIGYSRKYDWLLMAFVLLYPSQFINANLIQPELLLQTCVLFYSRHLLLLLQTRLWKHAFIMSLALIAGIMMKPVWYPFVMMHFVLLMLVSRRYRNGIIRPAVAALLPMFVVLIYSYWNDTRTGKIHFSSIQSINALLYNQEYYVRETYGADSARSFYEAELAASMAIKNFSKRYDYQSAKALQMLKDNFLPYTAMHIRKSVVMLADPGKGEMDLFTAQTTLQQIHSPSTRPFREVMMQDGISGVRNYISTNPSAPIALLVLLFCVLKLIGTVLFFFSRSIEAQYKWVFGLLLFYFVFITGPVAYARYLMPVSLLLIGCAALGYQMMLQRMRGGELNNKEE
ncbi:hypothetical protein CAP35_00075 [Chitinophagaceae bacterium IBVUCB1]|nr:hypothetical protein CAP35_00075 [Chitinophagaceae bacterium IBVUCB1]